MEKLISILFPMQLLLQKACAFSNSSFHQMFLVRNMKDCMLDLDVCQSKIYDNHQPTSTNRLSLPKVNNISTPGFGYSGTGRTWRPVSF